MNIALLEKNIRQLMRKRSTPGLALAVVKSGETLYSNGFGLRNLKQQLPMNSDTLIGIGSVTKSFAACLMVKLEETGKLALDDSVSRYLNTEPFSSRPEIKLYHLLSHSSGIPAMDAGENTFSFAFDNFSRIYPAATQEQFLAHLGDGADYIIYPPGERFFYNNDLYTCLAFIIEQVSGMSFEDYMRETLLDPLDMHRAVLTLQALENDPDSNVMTGYRPQCKDGKTQLAPSDLAIGGTVQASGGLYTSVNEMLNYAQCLLNQGRYKDKQILSRDAFEQLIGRRIQNPYGQDSELHYCLGLLRSGKTQTVPSEKIQHGGGMLTSSSNFVLLPELELGIVVVENSSTGICPLISDMVIAAVLDIAPDTLSEDLRIFRALEEIEGVYTSPHNLYRFKVSRKHNVLHVDAEIDDGPISFVLVVRDIDKLLFSRYTLRANCGSKVEFIRNRESGLVEFVSFDRYLYRKL